jgi:hypothetical protein
MNSSVTGGVLVEEPIERFRSFGAFGSPAWQGHLQLRALVRQRLGDRHANVFAVPHYDPETARMRWTSPQRGVVRPWHELAAEEQVRHSQSLEGLRRDLEDLVGKLRSQGEGKPGGSSGFASLLEQALKVPGEGRFLYLVGEQPVIAFWGFENAKGGSVEGLASAAALPAAAGLASLPSALPSLGVGPPPAAVRVAGMAPVAPAPVLSRPRPWWHWLLLFLGLLLLLIPLLFLLRSCMPTGAPGLGAGMTGVPMPSPGLQGGGSGGGGAGGGAVGGGGGAAGLPAAPAPAQPSAVDPSAPPGASGQGALAVPPGGSGGASLPVPPGPSGGAAPSAPPASAAGGPSGPGVVDPSQPAAPNSPSRRPPLSAPLPPPVPQDPKPLKLPAEPGTAAGMDFLLGDWKAGEGLVDKNTKAPLDLSMKFGPGGRGEMTVRRPDGTACTGAVQGRMEGGHLTVEGNRSVPCVDGGSYGAPKIECGRTSTGETQCEGVNRDGSRYFVDMRRR